MLKNLRKVVTYVEMILLFTVLGAAVLYVAGEPLASYISAEANMIIVNGAPADLKMNHPELSTLAMEKSTVDQSEIQVPSPDMMYGTIDCEIIALSAPIYYGDSETVLLGGVGHYILSGLPGQGRPILMSAHDSTFFAPLEQIAAGDTVTITTEYGKFNYSVVSTGIADETDTTAYDLTQEKEQLILYTCYPFGQLVGSRNERFYVYCDLITDDTK